MAPRMYTLDSKLLCGSPEIRIGEKIYAVDDRKNTVKKAMKLFNEKKNDTEKDEFDYIDELFKLAFGENAKEIIEMDISYSAYSKIAELVISAMTGEEPEKLKEKSFPEE